MQFACLDFRGVWDHWLCFSPSEPKYRALLSNVCATIVFLEHRLCLLVFAGHREGGIVPEDGLYTLRLNPHQTEAAIIAATAITNLCHSPNYDQTSELGQGEQNISTAMLMPCFLAKATGRQSPPHFCLPYHAQMQFTCKIHFYADWT